MRLHVFVSVLIFALVSAAAPVAIAEDPASISWRSYGPTLGGDVTTVVFHADDPLQAYAVVDAFGASDTYLYRTADGGDSWWPLSLEGFRPLAVAFEPSNHLVGFASGPDALHVTVDGGLTWNLVAGFPAHPVRTLAIDPGAPSIVYAGGDGGLYKSSDRGQTWERSSSGLPSTAEGRILAISSSDPRVMYYAAFDPGSEITRVFRSANSGAVWSQVSSSAQTVTVLAVSPTDPSTVYLGSFDGGVRASSDGGATWRAIPGPTQRPWALAMSPSDPGTLFLGGMEGSFRSTDGGESWAPLSGFPEGAQVRALSISGTDPSQMLAGTCCNRGGLYRSFDAGANWEPASGGIAGDSSIWSVAVAPSDPGVVFAGASGVTDLTVFRGTAHGRRWLLSGGGIPERTWIKSLAVDPSDPDDVFGATPVGLYRSLDGGRSWSKAALPQASAASTVAFAPSNPRIVYAGGTYNAAASGAFGAAVFKSVDGGDTWANASRGMLPTGDVADIEVASSDPNIVYAAAGNHGVYKSTDGGATWINHRIGIRSTGVLALAIDPVDHNIIYAGGTGTTVTAGTGLYRSTNGGLVWQPTTLTGASVSSIAIDPTDPDRIFATQYLAGARVVASTDGGATWAAMVTGLDGDPIIPNLAIDPSGQRLYAASNGHGVYVVELD